MNTSNLQKALEDLEKLEVAHGQLTRQQCEIEEKLGVAKSALIAAKNARQAARAAVALGEGSIDDQRAADQRVRELEAEIDALEPALEIIRKRVVDSGIPLKLARETARDEAKPLAARMAAEQLELARDLATRLCVAAVAWWDLDAVARGSRATGLRQAEANGIGPILQAHGIRFTPGAPNCDAEFTVGRSDGLGALLTPRQVLAAATKPPKGKAA